MRRLTLCAVILVGSTLPAEVGASVIDNFFVGEATFGCIGEGGGCTPYPGQTFVALDGPIAQSIEFVVLPNTFFSDDLEFRLLITDLQPNGRKPLNVLFESADITAPRGQLSKVTVNLGDLRLTPGEDYAFILDHFVLFDGEPGTGDIAASNNGSPGPDTYSQGDLIFPVFSDLSGTSRSGHFSQEWRGGGRGSLTDVAFRMSFGDQPSSIPDVTVEAIPEPSALTLAALGLLGLAGYRRRRRRN